VTLQIGDPDLVRWFVSQVRDAAAGAGREPGAVRVMAAAPAHVGDLADARDRTRWFPALVANHVVDLVNKYPRRDLPEELTTYIREREGYDYRHHAEVGSGNAAFVTDEIVDRFCLVGPVERHIERLVALAEAGVDQFNLYLMNGNEEEQLELYGRHVIPVLREVTAGRG
jgi:alkanesulfonate monooxygenase SsuD/methylene tetrahydromethanopterin reductase-like flavin-dependent oxidoreductase (luciferase family)